MQEEWKDLIGYEAFFKISSMGRVFSKRTGKILKLNLNVNGYPIFSTRIEGSGKSFLVHREVAKAFIPNPLNKPQVNHIDGNKTNGSVSNLEWVTASENMQHAYDAGLASAKSGTDNSSSKLSIEDVDYIRSNYKPRHKEFGARAMSRKFKVDKQRILDVIHHRSYK